MVKYECELGHRPRLGPVSICDSCTTLDCTNPIHDVIVRIGEIKRKERLWSDFDKPIKERRLSDYCCVLDCEGHPKNKK